jgi:O-antigen/teichoic acid export membrane protein
LLGLVSDAVFPMLRGRGKPHLITMLLASRTIVLLIVAWPLASAFGVVGAAVATICAEIPIQIASASIARDMLVRPFRGAGRVALAATVAGAAGAALGAGLDSLLGPPLGFVFGALVAGTASMAILWLLDRTLGLQLAEQLVRVFPVLNRLGFR